jgi:HEAT repeat protein
MTGIIKSKYTVRNTRALITGARHTCFAAILFSLVANTAWGQHETDLRISTLTSELKQSDYFVRWRAAKALLIIGSYSKADIPALIEALKIEDGDISERARDALVKLGPDAAPALIRALKYQDSIDHSGNAFQALMVIGVPAIPALIEALKDPNEDVRLGALEVLQEPNFFENTTNIRTSLVPILVEALKDPNPAIRRAAVANISCSGDEATRGYLALIEALKDQDATVRSAADFRLGCILVIPGHPIRELAVANVGEALKSGDRNVRSFAVQALARMGSTAKPWVNALIEASKDPDVKVRSNVARALGTIEPANDAVVATLLHALRDSNKNVRGAAASALKSAPARAAIYPLIVALQDSEASVRRSAANSLARRDAGDAVPRLIQLMGDRDEEVRNAARGALGAVGPGKGASALAGALKHQNGNIRVGATLILYNFGLYPKALVALVEALKDQDASVRSNAVLSILSFAKGPDWKSAIPALIRALENADQRVRYRAALALSGVKSGEQRYPDFGELPKSVIPVLPKQVILILIEALKDQDPAVRSEAAWALAGTGPAAKAAVPALIESVEDRNLEVCRYATYALKNAGAKSPAIIPALIKLLKHPDRAIREVATEALVNIGAPAVPPLVRLLMGQDSTLRVKSYYVLLSIGDVFALVATLKSRDKHLRSLVFEAIEDIRVDPTRGIQAPDLLFDPSRKYLFQTVKNGCGIEDEAETMFVSQVDSGKSFAILASSQWLGTIEFLESGGRYYLLIVEGRGEATCQPRSFWLYDVKENEFVIHAEGGIEETERGVFSYGYCGENDSIIPVGKVTMKNLLNRELPLRLLPRPMPGLTLRRNTKVVDSCNQTDSGPSAIMVIRKAGTRVLVLGKREDASFEVYYKGTIAIAPKGSLKMTK